MAKGVGGEFKPTVYKIQGLFVRTVVCHIEGTWEGQLERECVEE